MVDKTLEKDILDLGQQITTLMKKEQPGIFNKDFWSGRMLELTMKDPRFKVEMFRFVDVFSILKTKDQISQHLKEYFLRPGLDFPTAIQLLIKGMSSSLGLFLGGGTMTSQITDMAKRFIVGADVEEAISVCAKLRAEKVGFTADLLGEAAVSEHESGVYLSRYQEAIEAISLAANHWSDEPLLDQDSLGAIPKVNVSIKLSSLFSAIDPLAFEHSVSTLYHRLLPVFVQAKEKHVFINLDLEQSAYKALTFELFKRLRTSPELAGYPHMGLVIQAYLKSSLDDAHDFVRFAKKCGESFTIRLVKGAYWDYETILAKQKNWPIPVFENKAETDDHYETITQVLLDAYPRIRVAFGSHNLRSLAHAMAYAKKKKLPARAYEIQMLYGMAEPIRKALVSMGERVRVYAPIGDLLPGMAYLVRRLLENTSNDSFLRQRFVEAKSLESLMVSPKTQIPTQKNEDNKTESHEFLNATPRDFSMLQDRQIFLEAMNNVEKKLPYQINTCVHQQAFFEESRVALRYNPACLTQLVSRTHEATIKQTTHALEVAFSAREHWAQVSVHERAVILRRAAQLIDSVRDELSALMLYEVGKNPKEADADVCEAIDFCRYYAQEAERLMQAHAVGSVPGEQNQMVYEPRGVAVVIAPWNFPCAILTGMVVASLVTGNPVIMKPAEQSPVIAYRVYQILRQAGVPSDVLQFLPGKGEEVGEQLVSSPQVSLIAFTGSRLVGLRILQKASVVEKEQAHIKKTILELGGKNAIIVDSDADLDEAVLGCVHSAFGFQGQKCSAASLVIVLESRYEEFCARIKEAMKSLVIGPVCSFENTVGPVIDEDAYLRLLNVIETGKKRYAYEQLPVPAHLIKGTQKTGYFVPPTLFFDVDAKDELAQEEFFGPIVAIIKAQDFKQALEMANDTRYALTGGVFSRSPLNLELAKKSFLVGNLYLNRGITGAMVNRQPFGGFKLSGIGSKAGGPTYLLQFVEPRVITENTMRRGFAPDL